MQKVHGSPLDLDDAAAVQQMNDERHQKGRSTSEKDGGEEGQASRR